MELFSKMVMEKNLSEDKATLEALNLKYAKVLDDMEQKCSKERDTYLEHVKNKAKDQERRLLSKAHSESQKKVLIKKNALLIKLKNEIVEAIEAFAITEAYEAYFHERFERALSPHQNDDNLVVGLKARDLAYVPYEMKTIIDDGIIGGFYMIKNGKIKYDYTLNSEVDEIEEYLGCMINALFNPSQEACSETK
ncbi:hypothetical protein [Fusibacter sp. 3D3]|uniref:hypothetical protein n=1 Tax=Fusibacter sp. 3D3 TaxID=1048380 RepID=UPI000852B951|nr:hypothetical protein [Fusibacter sp. 3D3]GAU77904.1 hypothetical protein F3D3_2533 [Fusibacter sp. 3D3]